MRALALVLLCPSAVFAIPPESSQSQLDAAAVELRTLCHTDTKVLVDLESFDAASMKSEFSPTLQCLVLTQQLAAACKGFPDPKVDVSPVLELTEVRCTLDQKHEANIRAWFKDHPRRKRDRSDDTYRVFLEGEYKNVPGAQSSGGSTYYPSMVFTWSGTKLVAAFTQDVMNVDETVARGLAAEGAVRAARPGGPAKRKALEEKLKGAVDSRSASQWKPVAAGNKERVGECDARIAAAVKDTAEKCDFTINATVDWASLEAPQDDIDLCRAVGSTCSAGRDLEIFSGACMELLSSLGDHCKDDKMQALILKKVKSVSCKFDRNTSKGKQGSFPIKLEGGVITATWGWDSQADGPHFYRWLKNNL